MSFPPVSNPLEESEKDCSAGGAGSESPPRFQNGIVFCRACLVLLEENGPGRPLGIPITGSEPRADLAVFLVDPQQN